MDSVWLSEYQGASAQSQRRLGVDRRRLAMAVQVDSLAQCRPRQQRTLDAGRILLHALQRVELLFELGGGGSRLAICCVNCCTDAVGFVQLWPLTSSVIIDADAWLIEHPRPVKRDVADVSSLVDRQRQLDLVAAQRIVAAVGQRRLLQPTVVPRVLIVVEDDLPRQIFECSPVLHSYLDRVALHADLVRFDGLERGQLNGGASA